MSEELKIESKHKLNKKFLFITIIGIIIITVTSITFIVPASVRAKTVQEQLQLGAKYLSELNYEQAEAVYLVILNIDPKCEDAYLGLANIYLATGQYDKAEEILKRAQEELGLDVESIQEKLEELSSLREEMERKIYVTNTPTPTVVPTATNTPTPQPTSTPTRL